MEKGLFQETTSDQYHVKATENTEESIKLTEVEFEYFTCEYNDRVKSSVNANSGLN